jgi:plasmid stabilization system protein ParE
MIPIFYIKEAGAKGLLPLSPAPQIPADPASASLRTISLDDSEHLLHNHRVSVASLRLLFTFAPERRSASLRNRCSPSPEYPLDAADRVLEEIYQTVRSLVAFPRHGHTRPDLTTKPLRFHSVRDYVIAYAADEDPLIVIAVLHGRRSPRVIAAILRERD